MMVRETGLPSCNDSGYLSSSPTAESSQQRYLEYSGAPSGYDTNVYEHSTYEQYGSIPMYVDTQVQGTEGMPPLQMGIDHERFPEGYSTEESWHGVAGQPYAYTQPHQPYLGYDMITQVQPPVILGPNGKPKRRRIPTPAQRRAANIRERRRMFNLNESFDLLRKRVPTFAYEKRLSRIETLRLAITYISFMTDLLEGKNEKDIKLVTHKGLEWQMEASSPSHSENSYTASQNQ